MAPTDRRRWSDADRELIREAIHSKFDNVDEQTDAELDALTAAGWRPPARNKVHIDPPKPEVRVIPVPVDPRTGRPYRG